MNLEPLLFALLASVGNAFFAIGQKKASHLNNYLPFVVLIVLTCIIMLIIMAPFFGQTNYIKIIKENGYWALLSGVGLFIALFGFNLMYSKYGASSYVYYAVLSIVTTSIIAGVFIFKESLNIYHWFAILFSIITIVLFSVGNNIAKI